MPTQDEIFEKVKTALIDALALEEDEIVPEATITSDLGAESIDFLDIVFRLEKAFNIKIGRGELFPDSILNDPQYVQGGKVTEAGIAELRKRMPFANLDKFAANPNVREFSNLFTVDVICKYLTSKLETVGG